MADQQQTRHALKQPGDELTVEEWNALVRELNALLDEVAKLRASRSAKEADERHYYDDPKTNGDE